MAVKLADAVAYLKTDDSDLKSGLSSAEGKIQSSGGKFGSVLQGIGMSVGLGIAGIAANALGQVVSFMGDSIGAASDMGETVSKTNVLFGESAAGLLAWAETASTSLGQSKQQALDAATTFATFGKSAGLTGEDLTKFSTGFTGLATDLASFNNTSPEQAIEAIGAALRGEAEPLRAYGVLLDDASMRQKAMEMGIISTTKEALTPQQKVLAAQALIYEQTSAAQGDFARTSGGLANQQRILDAQMQDLKTTVGEALLPVMLSFTSALNGLVQQVLPPLAAFIREKVVPAMTAIADVINATVGPALNAIMGWITSVGDTMRTQTDGPFAYLQQWFEKVMPLIQTLVGNVTAALTEFWTAHGEQITAIVTTLLNGLYILWDTQLKTILDIVTAFFQLLTGDWEGAGETLKGVVERWWDVLQGAVRFVIDHVRDAWTSVDWGGIGQTIIDGIIDGLRNAGQGLIDFIGGLVDNAIGGIVGGMGGLGASALGDTPMQQIGRNAATLATGGGRFGAAASALAPITITLQQTFNGAADPVRVGQASQDGILSALRAVGAA
jgi:phage-related protein